MTKRIAYSYPHRSRRARIAYLAEHESYHPMNSWNRGFCLSWNVKIHNADFSGKVGEYKVNPALDEAWEKRCEDDSYIFWNTCEDVFRSMAEDYSTYPGDDQGSYDFGLNGRSSGHMILMECKIVNQPRAWRAFPMIWDSREDYVEWLEGLPVKMLERFYKAIRCMDQDFRRSAIEKEFAYQINFQRQQWEEEIDDQQKLEAREQEEARPDMYRGQQ